MQIYYYIMRLYDILRKLLHYEHVIHAVITLLVASNALMII